ncbi:PDDEXK nuclease domain-containing protein [Arthrobacter rhizosphaerae]|uniref:PDDEXK nuclease domain-containing protein n=1 Tax=Arthrobacter rhizosphaerae TaxID=2855490 RepID=UPI003556CF43
MAECDLENALTSRITETLRELGPGFSFVGRQVHFDVDGDDFYVDMLFFNIDQSRYVVVELKTGKFQPEWAGKLNFYVALVDDMLRREHHNETIGILICGTKNDRSVRYSLGRSTWPIAVAAYTYDNFPRLNKKPFPTKDIWSRHLNGPNLRQISLPIDPSRSWERYPQRVSHVQGCGTHVRSESWRSAAE